MYIHVYTTYMTTKVSKWGNSLAFRIPRTLADKYHLYDGASIVLIETPKGALISPVKENTKRKLPTLREALADFKPSMIEKVDWGRDIGKEKIK